MMIYPGGARFGRVGPPDDHHHSTGTAPMPSSPERIAANRRNAALSTGPRTPEGKARSRGNALMHGLTGAGIAIPGEDPKVVEARFEALADDLQVRGERERILAHRAAFLALRLERCARYEAAVISDRVRFAGTYFDDARKADVETAVARLSREPMTSLRKLGRTLEGANWLVGAWERLLEDLDCLGSFELKSVIRAEHLMGRKSDEPGVSRVAILNNAIAGNFLMMTPYGTPPEPHDPDRAAERSKAARAELRRMLMDGAERARDIRDSLPLEDFERSREDSALLALFDTRRTAGPFLRYETAAARELHAIFAEFDQARAEEAARAEAEEQQSSPIGECTCGELASFGNPADPVPISPEPEATAEAEAGSEASDPSPKLSTQTPENPQTLTNPGGRTQVVASGRPTFDLSLATTPSLGRVW